MDFVTNKCTSECPAGTKANEKAIICEALCSSFLDSTYPVWNTATEACGRCEAGLVSLDGNCVDKCGPGYFVED
jgi:hypothetical protein